MTEQDKTVQDLRRRVKLLEEALDTVVKAMKVCRYCKYLDADCSPTGDCEPEWKGE